MSKKRAFVKYTKSGKIIPGSLIVATKGGYPVDGLYKEVSTDLCCETVTFSTQVDDLSINNVSVEFFCNSTRVAISYSNRDSGNAGGLVQILNEEFGAEYGTFSYITDGTLTLEMKTSKVKELCPDGYLSFVIFSD